MILEPALLGRRFCAIQKQEFEDESDKDKDGELPKNQALSESKVMVAVHHAKYLELSRVRLRS
jgi:hypothetical protein